MSHSSPSSPGPSKKSMATRTELEPELKNAGEESNTRSYGKFDLFNTPIMTKSRKPSTPLHFGFDSESEDDQTCQSENEGNESDPKFEKRMEHYFGHKRLVHFARDVTNCDGSDSLKTLAWLRAVHSTPEPIGVANLTARGHLLEFILSRPKATWTQPYFKVAREFVHSQFRTRQLEALNEIKQRPGESLRQFNREVEQLVFEAFD